MVKVKVGAPETGGGTWLHPKLAVPFSRWLDINFKEIDRDALPYGELDLLARLEAFNTMLIGTGIDYEARKKALQNFSAKWRASRTPALAEVA